MEACRWRFAGRYIRLTLGQEFWKVEIPSRDSFWYQVQPDLQNSFVQKKSAVKILTKFFHACAGTCDVAVAMLQQAF